jgi:hypothetical protein
LCGAGVADHILFDVPENLAFTDIRQYLSEGQVLDSSNYSGDIN